MTQLTDLDDDCLMQVLDHLPPDQLFKMLRINSLLRRLAGVKMGVKIKAVAAITDIRWLNESRPLFADCAHHLDSITRDQELVLGKIIKKKKDAETVALLSLLPKLSGLKAIDFVGKQVNRGILEAIVQHCPDIECLKIGWLYFRDDDWEWFLNRIGEKIIHFTKNHQERDHRKLNLMKEDVLLKMMVEKCGNIKRLDWLEGYSTISLSVVKKVPKDCWINLNCYHFAEELYEDVVDELEISEMKWSSFGNRVDRLSKLSIGDYKDESFDGGINFTRLKTLDIISTFEHYGSYHEFVNCLIASRYPRLEEFCFEISGFDVNMSLTEDDFDALFQRMPSLEKLVISLDNHYYDPGELPHLPNASILRLKNLKFIDFDVQNGFQDNLNIENFFQRFEKYIDEIGSLKKLTFDIRSYLTDWHRVRDWIQRIKEKQSRVEVRVKRIQIIK